jgi:flagellar FliL protein
VAGDEIASTTMSQQPAAPAAAAPAKSRRTLFIAVAALVVLGGGGGAYWKFFAAAPTEAAAEESKEPAEPPAMVSFDPFVVNLSDPGSPRFLRVTLALVVDGEAHAKEFEENTVVRMKVRSALLEMLSQQRATVPGDTRRQSGPQEGRYRTCRPQRRRTEDQRCPLLRIHRPVTRG